MSDELEIRRDGVKANGPFAITILVLVALVGLLVWQQFRFMDMQMTKLDEATWIMSLPNEARACLALDPPVSLRNRIMGLPDLQAACRKYLEQE